jgi:ABC-type branched-subunit amino acid transport system ATPase component/ABC-type branched-subunit amino acid transport system permease subunit
MKYFLLFLYVIAFLVCFIFTCYANSYYVFIMATLALTAIVGIGLNILLGLAGQVSFGHVGFYAIGAYTVAILTTAAKLDFWLALPLAIALSAAVGGLLALPALRVRGPYLAMITIAFGFVVENGAAEWRGLTGGQNGIMGVPPLKAFGVAFGERGVALLAIALCGLLVIGFWRLQRSAWGSAMRAVKDSEVAAESVGLNPVAIKALAFALSAACAGLAGALFAPLSGFVTPSTFAFLQSILFVLVVIVGGAGTLSGPLVGALIVVLLPELLAGLAEYRLLFFGALMLVVLWLAPEGIVGAVQRLVRRRTKSALPSSSESFQNKSESKSLQISGLTLAFGGVKAATDVSFQARPGEVTSLIGPNGAGKTTVLNMLSGFYTPQSGAIQLGTRNIEGIAAWRVARAGVARTYQTSQLFGSMTVLENLVIASPTRGKKGNTEQENAISLLSFVGYRGDIHVRAADLPHVDRRLVEIARALATRPAVLLLDEPAAGLSRTDKAALAALIGRIAQAGVTVLLVEHDMEIVMGISHHVVVLDAGTPIAAGTPQQVQQDPAVRNAYLGSAQAKQKGNFSSKSTGETLLEVGRLEAGYGAEPVLKGIDLRVNAGELVAVLGANGAGKSTLMRAISGLHRPVGGSVLFQKNPINNLPTHKIVAQGVVLVPEGRQVFPELSVLDNIRLGAYLRKAVAASEIEAMLARFPRLRERLQQRAGLLSGGEQQMLALARGLMGKPRLLLLDEPSLGLAPTVIDELFASLDRLRGEQVTILLVDQMAGLALALADRAYVIDGGRITSSGSAAEIAADGALEKAYLFHR